MGNKCDKNNRLLHSTYNNQSLDKATYAYGIERIIVNDGNGQEEIRWVFFKDTIRGKKQTNSKTIRLYQKKIF